jgi:hypothetical protein
LAGIASKFGIDCGCPSLVPLGQITRLSLQPLANDARALLAILRPVFRETIIHYVVALDAKRVLDDLGGAVAVVTLDGLVMGTAHKVFCRQVIASGSRSPARLPPRNRYMQEVAHKEENHGTGFAGQHLYRAFKFPINWMLVLVAVVVIWINYSFVAR